MRNLNKPYIYFVLLDVVFHTCKLSLMWLIRKNIPIKSICPYLVSYIIIIGGTDSINQL